MYKTTSPRTPEVNELDWSLCQSSEVGGLKELIQFPCSNRSKRAMRVFKKEAIRLKWESNVVDVVSMKMWGGNNCDTRTAQLRHAEDTSESTSSSHQVAAYKRRLDFNSIP